MPFDRLVRTVDQWAGDTARSDIFAQIGPTDYCPSNVRWARFLQPQEYQKRFAGARTVVAHAGTGSIITALQLSKPIVIMPRRANLRETRNDHQVATAEYFRRFSSITVAWDETELVAKLSRVDDLHGLRAVGSYASGELLGAIRNFIDSG